MLVDAEIKIDLIVAIIHHSGKRQWRVKSLKLRVMDIFSPFLYEKI